MPHWLQIVFEVIGAYAVLCVVGGIIGGIAIYWFTRGK